MTHTSKTIVFFGTEDFSAYTLEVLIDHGYNIGAIITKPDTRRGRRKELSKPRVKEIGEQHHIPVWQPTKLADIAEDIKNFDTPIGILVSYGKIIPQTIIDLFTPGIINLHPSLLPLYRGPSPIETAILHGDTMTGISIMQLSAAMDAGPVYLQEDVPLVGTETAVDLYAQLGIRGAELLASTLPQILDETIPAAPQNNEAASYCQLIKKEDGIINWHKSALEIEREVRAYQGWPQSRAMLGKLEVIITKASVESDVLTRSTTPGNIITKDAAGEPALIIATSDGFLRIEALKPLGKKEMPAQAFLTGYNNHIS